MLETCLTWHEFQRAIKTTSSSSLFLLTEQPSNWSPLLDPTPSNPSSLGLTAKGISELKSPQSRLLALPPQGLHGLNPNSHSYQNPLLLHKEHLALQLNCASILAHPFLYLPYSHHLHILLNLTEISSPALSLLLHLRENLSEHSPNQ